MKRIVLTILIILFLGSYAHAFYPYGTIPQGMGGAYSAVGNDIAALYYNPASLVPPLLLEGGLSLGFKTDGLSLKGLENIRKFFGGVDVEELTPDDLELDLGLEQSMISALGGVQFNIPVPNLYPAVALISDHSIDYHNGALDYSIHNALLLNARYTILSPPFDLMAITIGANVKILHGEKYRYSIQEQELDLGENDILDDIIKEEHLASGDGYGLDLGLIVRATDILTIGLSLRDIAHSISWDDPDYATEKVFPAIRGGVALRVPLLATILAGDVELFNHDGDQLTRLHLGVQKGFLFNTLILRGGLYTQPEKGEEAMVYTGGLGVNLRAIKTDLGILFDGEENKFMGVSISAGVRF